MSYDGKQHLHTLLVVFQGLLCEDKKGNKVLSFFFFGKIIDCQTDKAVI